MSAACTTNHELVGRILGLVTWFGLTAWEFAKPALGDGPHLVARMPLTD